jgi:hypothetical protein
MDANLENIAIALNIGWKKIQKKVKLNKTQ